MINYDRSYDWAYKAWKKCPEIYDASAEHTAKSPRWAYTDEGLRRIHEAKLVARLAGRPYVDIEIGITRWCFVFMVRKYLRETREQRRAARNGFLT